MKFVITPVALQDLQDAIDYYNHRQIGLGRRFEEIANSTFSRIRNSPKAGTFAKDEIRFRSVERFPFIVTYEENDFSITILRIFNTYLNPKKR